MGTTAANVNVSPLAIAPSPLPAAPPAPSTKPPATRGTGKVIKELGIDVEVVNKVQEGRPHVVDMLKNHEIDFIVNTTEGKQAIADSFLIRRTALQNKVVYTTTMAGGRASVAAIQHGEDRSVRSLQKLHG